MHVVFHAFRRLRRGSSSQDFSRPLPFLVWTNGLLVVSPLGVKIVDSGLYLEVFRTKSQIFYTLSLRVVHTIYNVLVHVEIADPSSTQDASPCQYGLARHKSSVAQWLEHPTGVRYFYFVLCSWDVDHRSHFFAERGQETSIFKGGKYFLH